MDQKIDAYLVAMNQEIEIKDIPILEPLIKEIFIDRTIFVTE